MFLHQLYSISAKHNVKHVLLKQLQKNMKKLMFGLAVFQ